MTITVTQLVAPVKATATASASDAAQGAAGEIGAGQEGALSGLDLAFSTLLSQKLQAGKDTDSKEPIAATGDAAPPAIDPNAINIALQQIGAALNNGALDPASRSASAASGAAVPSGPARTPLDLQEKIDSAVPTGLPQTPQANRFATVLEHAQATPVQENIDELAAAEAQPAASGAPNTTALAATGMPQAQRNTPVQLGTLPVPIDSPRFAEATAERVKFVIGNNIQSAQIDLHPAELGPISINVQMKQGDASISFGAVQPETRQALENALPRLRELLAQSGIALTDAQVGNQAFAQQQQSESRQSGSARTTPMNDTDTGTVTTTTVPLNRHPQGSGLLDMYA